MDACAYDVCMYIHTTYAKYTERSQLTYDKLKKYSIHSMNNFNRVSK